MSQATTTSEVSRTQMLSVPEQRALAMLTSGHSYAEAMRESGLTFDDVQHVWIAYGRLPQASLQASQ